MEVSGLIGLGRSFRCERLRREVHRAERFSRRHMLLTRDISTGCTLKGCSRPQFNSSAPALAQGGRVEKWLGWWATVGTVVWGSVIRDHARRSNRLQEVDSCAGQWRIHGR
jgi:hypothetical protein